MFTWFIPPPPYLKLENELYLQIDGISILSSNTLKGEPNFTIHSLLDKIPGKNFETDEFMSETIIHPWNSYKSSPDKFSMSKRNELRSLTTHPFNEIGITETRLHNEIGIAETRLHNEIPLVNLGIEGYILEHTSTNTISQGTCIYIRSCYDSKVIQKFSKSIDDIRESLIIELKRIKILLLAVFIYWHHSPLENTQGYKSKQSYKISAIIFQCRSCKLCFWNKHW